MCLHEIFCKAFAEKISYVAVRKHFAKNSLGVSKVSHVVKCYIISTQEGIFRRFWYLFEFLGLKLREQLSLTNSFSLRGENWN